MNPTHVHPFTAEALVVRSEMWLTVGGHTRHIRDGGTAAGAAKRSPAMNSRCLTSDRAPLHTVGQLDPCAC
jgi:hypothetical protein